MSASKTPPEQPPFLDADLKNLAEEALDLWQDFLDSYAADPKARAQLAQMNQMFAAWQGAGQGVPGTFPSTAFAGWPQMGQNAPHAARQNSAEKQEPDSAAAAQLLELEQRVARLESLFSRGLDEAKRTKTKKH